MRSSRPAWVGVVAYNNKETTGKPVGSATRLTTARFTVKMLPTPRETASFSVANSMHITTTLCSLWSNACRGHLSSCVEELAGQIYNSSTHRNNSSTHHMPLLG